MNDMLWPSDTDDNYIGGGRIYGFPTLEEFEFSKVINAGNARNMISSSFPLTVKEDPSTIAERIQMRLKKCMSNICQFRLETTNRSHRFKLVSLMREISYLMYYFVAYSEEKSKMQVLQEVKDIIDKITSLRQIVPYTKLLSSIRQNVQRTERFENLILLNNVRVFLYQFYCNLQSRLTGRIEYWNLHMIKMLVSKQCITVQKWSYVPIDKPNKNYNIISFYNDRINSVKKVLIRDTKDKSALLFVRTVDSIEGETTAGAVQSLVKLVAEPIRRSEYCFFKIAMVVCYLAVRRIVRHIDRFDEQFRTITRYLTYLFNKVSIKDIILYMYSVEPDFFKGEIFCLYSKLDIISKRYMDLSVEMNLLMNHLYRMHVIRCHFSFSLNIYRSTR